MSVFSSAFLLFPSLSKSGSRFEKIGANWILKGSSDFFGYCMMPPQVIFSETHEPSSPRKKLLGLLSDGRFHSGTSLADELGLSRTSVWKQVAGLGELGIRIDAVSGRGYRLCRALELLDETMIRSGLEADVINEIGCFHIHDLIDSTNRCLVSALTEPGSKGAVCLAESQSAGKGRNGKSWVSPFGSNVYLSLTWHYPDGPAALSGLSLAVGVAVVRALSSLNVRDIRLKWPNDILWNEKKVGGILIEVFGDTHGPCSVVIGLGLNHAMSLDQAAAIDQQWVDLATITHHAQPGRNLLVASLINEMLRIVSGFNQSGLGPFLREWRELDCMQGKAVILHSGNSEIAGTVLGIRDDGLIQLATSDGELRSFASGEVSFRPGRN